MATETDSGGTAKPLWRQILDFPLVAMLIAVALFIGANALGIISGKPFEGMGQPERAIVRGVIAIALVLAAYKLVIVRLGEHPRDDLPARGALKNLGLGVLLGGLLFSLVVGVAAAFDVYNIVGYGGTGELVYDLVGIAIMPAFMEELLFRGILFRWIEEFGGSWAGLLISSALFGLAHLGNPGATWVASLWIALEAGILLGGAYMLTRSLWMPMGLHAAWNFTQGFIFDVPVSGTNQNGLVEAKLSGPEILSGGGFGLEASVIALAIATAAGVWLVYLAVRRGELMPPWWVRRKLARWSAASDYSAGIR
jgi:membrane protease YdiL (CAAX protease family)